ncbi:hypothetical protein COO60DRAFT_18949 [Scenedesmus sp. NREL 46B-D3]|nr:hypothetical protein COO60DRAFT_18949 [Scenedesmus sp. NREL 46B-D3]
MHGKRLLLLLLLLLLAVRVEQLRCCYNKTFISRANLPSAAAGRSTQRCASAYVAYHLWRSPLCSSMNSAWLPLTNLRLLRRAQRGRDTTLTHSTHQAARCRACTTLTALTASIAPWPAH